MPMGPIGPGEFFSPLAIVGGGVVVVRGPIRHTLARRSADVLEGLHP